MVRASICEFVAKRMQYIELMQASGVNPGTARWEQLLSDGVTGIMQMVRTHRHFTVDEAMNVRQQLDDKALLSPESVDAIMQHLDARVDISSGTSSGLGSSAPKQTHFFVDNYVTEQLWACLRDQSVLKDNKMLAVVKLFVSLGLRVPNEKTFAMGCALATHAHGLEVNTLLIDVRNFKMCFRAIVDENLGLLIGPDTYPETAEKFQELHPEVYAQAFPDDQPIPSMWPSDYRAMVKKLAPCRDTKAGVDKAMVQYSASSASASASRSGGSLPGFRLCPPARPATPGHRMAAIPNLSSEPSAVPWASAAPAQALLALPAPCPEYQAQPAAPTMPPPAALPAAPTMPRPAAPPAAPTQPQPSLGPEGLPAWAPPTAVAAGTSAAAAVPTLAEATDRIKQKLLAGKADAKAEAAGNEGDDVSVEGDDAPAPRKRPAAAPAGGKTAKMRKPAAAPKVLWEREPPCPREGSAAVNYKQGRVYTSTPRKSFRVIRAVPDYATELRVPWGADKPNQAAWKKALKAIEDYHR